MGQCVSRKAGAVIAASGHHDSPSYRIMEKSAKIQRKAFQKALRKNKSILRSLKDSTVICFNLQKHSSETITTNADDADNADDTTTTTTTKEQEGNVKMYDNNKNHTNNDDDEDEKRLHRAT
uniref:Uncharacterized protein n=1 Tax=Vespula pensylvanica TaxID=30213 RepID=A0A836UX03_VESPE|nr:hypothetical protein H0235_013751 [Vespula pensylvanica]